MPKLQVITVKDVRNLVQDHVLTVAVILACSHAIWVIAVRVFKWLECVAIVSLWFSTLNASAGRTQMIESENVSSHVRANVQNSCHVDISAKPSVIRVHVQTLSDV